MVENFHLIIASSVFFLLCQQFYNAETKLNNGNSRFVSFQFNRWHMWHDKYYFSVSVFLTQSSHWSQVKLSKKEKKFALDIRNEILRAIREKKKLTSKGKKVQNKLRKKKRRKSLTLIVVEKKVSKFDDFP